MKEPFRVGDPMDPKNLDHRSLMLAHMRHCLHRSGTEWSEVVPRLAGLSLTQSLPSMDATDIDDAHWIVHTLSNHAVALYEQVYPSEEVFTTEPRGPLVSTLYVNIAHTYSCNLRSSMRSAEVSTNIFVGNLDYKVLPTPNSHA